MADRLPLFEHLHFLHRVWRYRLRSERGELAFMRRCRLVGKTAVDIGAHRGIYSYWMHRAIGPGGRVVAFEPQPEMQQCIEHARHSFHLDRLTLERCGLSSSAGSTRLVRDPRHTGGARLDRSGDAQPGANRKPANEVLESFDVAVTTLDQYFADYAGPPVAFIKCDVEGHEAAVFEGGRDLLERDRPTLLVEVHDRHVREGSLFRLLAGLGYDAFLLHGSRLIPMAEYDRVRPSIAKAYLNYVFQPKQG